MSNRGFTLLEIVIVVALIGLIAAIAIPNMLNAREKSHRAVCLSNREALERAEQWFYAQNNRHSYSVDELRNSDLYSSAVCPKAGVFFWLDFPAETDLYQSIMGCSVHGVDTTTEENEQIFNYVLFRSDFSDSTAWRVVSGNWKFENGVARSPLTGENRAFAGEEDWTNYTIIANARVVQGKGLGIYFRATDVKNVDGYVFQVDPGLGNKFVFRRLTDGKESSPIATANGPSGFDWYASHQIEIKVENDTFVAYVDGKEVLRASDSTYGNGMIGIRSWSGSEAEFNDIEVKQQPEEKK